MTGIFQNNGFFPGDLPPIRAAHARRRRPVRGYAIRRIALRRDLFQPARSHNRASGYFRGDLVSLRPPKPTTPAFFAVTKLQKRNTPSLSTRFLVIAKPTRAMRETDGVIIAVQPSSGD
jgi:hypothetical protein